MRALILDDDQTLLAATQKAVASCGIGTCEAFATGEAAWERLDAQAYDLVVLDWRLPGVSGVALLNRLRAGKRNALTPVLVVSGYLTPADFRLIEELPLTAFLEKPFALPLFQFKVKDLLAGAAWLKEKHAELQEAFAGGEPQALTALVKAAPSALSLLLAAARLLIERGNLDEADALLRGHLETDPETPSVLTLLGKVHLLKRRFDEALKVLSKAQAGSPKSLERLCLLGDANLKTLNTPEAAKHFNAAVALDPDDARALAGQSVTASINSYLALPSTTTVPKSFASLLNAVGISYVRTERFDAGIQYYKNAMTYVEEATVQARLAFNIGLGYVRAGLTEQGVPWLRKATTLSEGRFQRGEKVLKALGVEVKSFEPAYKRGEVETKPAEPQTPIDAFDHLKAVIANLRLPDATLFGETGRTDLRKTSEAYVARLGDVKICVFLPNTMRPADIKKLDAAAAKEKSILVLRNDGSRWLTLWPELKPEAPAKAS